MSWDDALAAADRVAAGIFDTPGFTAVPMRQPERAANATPIADPDRVAFGFAGTLESAPELSALANSNAPRPADRAVRHVAKTCLTALASGWPWLPRQGDRIRAPDGALYQLAAAPDSDGTARLAFWLNRLAG